MPNSPSPAAGPEACILHGDFHLLEAVCEAAARAWAAQRLHLDAGELHDAYQAAAEQRMLDRLISDANP